MSVQLIVFPQNYEGQYNSIASAANNFIVDGINFNTINTSNSYDSTAISAPTDALTNAPPTQVNTWFRFRSTLFGTPTIPTELSGNLTLLSVPVSTQAGVYQKLSNLVVGTVYQMTLTLSTTGLGNVLTAAYNGTIQISSSNQSASLSSITFTWTAATANDTIIIWYNNTTTDNIAISNITVDEQGFTPSIIYELQDGQVICDLYENEDIPLSLSVDDFKNVAEKVQSYSKAFNLPATKRNNQIFDNIFDITRTDTGLNFNPYKRTKAILKQDGFLLFEGYLRMLDISDKSGETSYNVNLYSEVVALADVLGDKTFSELDFTELAHDYQKTNIQNSWNDAGTGITYTNASTSGFRNAYSTVKYPFVDWTHQQLVGGSTGTAAISGNPEYTALEQIFRPFINIKYLIDRIFQAVPFTYESEFFNTDDFKKLYMDFNWGADNAPVMIGLTSYDLYWTKADDFPPASVYAGTSFTNLVLRQWTLAGIVIGQVPPNYDLSTNIITATADGEQYDVSGSYNIQNTSTTDTIDVECQWIKNTSVVATQTLTMPPSSSALFNFTFNEILMNGDTLQAQFKRVDPASANTIRMNETGASLSTVNFNVNTDAITSSSLLQTLRGELGQWDFLKGLLTMFNLVTLPDEDNPSNIKIEPYNDVFIPTATAGDTLADRGITHDWTDKVDVSEMKLMPLTDLNKKTIFKFVEDEDDYAFNVYKRDVGGHLYGSKKYDATAFTILAGEDEIVAEPFAATVVKPLEDIWSDLITPALYSMNDDETPEGFENSPRIMYNNGKKTTVFDYYIPAQNGLASDNLEEYLQFSHLTSLPPGAIATQRRDFHFGECQLIEGLGAPTNNNLFNLYWLPYYSELYNPDTRIMTIKVNLSPSDINTFKFNDTVFIKNRTFRVNKIDYKPNDLATVEFILIP
jgi:hypothetical protein